MIGAIGGAALSAAGGAGGRLLRSKCHSFAASTPVLMADGSAKPISKIKAGDKVVASVPGGHTETHKVQRVIVTRTDHDFVDLTIATSHPGRGPPATLTTTATHPFYDITQSAFVDAAHIKPGDKLQQPDGTTATVTKVHRYTATQVTYDLTINGLHTYYVEAGTTPILVHNCGSDIGAAARTATRSAPKDATMTAVARIKKADMMEAGYSGQASRPSYLEPEIEEAARDGGQMFQGDAVNCAEMRACNNLFANHAANFEAKSKRPLRISDIEFLTVKTGTGLPEAACLSCQSALVRRGATDLSVVLGGGS